MKPLSLLGRVILIGIVVSRSVAAPVIQISTGLFEQPVVVSFPLGNRLASRVPAAPDLATALWVVTPLPIVVPPRFGYYGTVRSINEHGEVLGSDLSQTKFVAPEGWAAELGNYRFHLNAGRQLDNAGRLALNPSVGNEGLLFKMQNGLAWVEKRFDGTKLTSVDNDGGVLGVVLNFSRSSDQDYWGEHFFERNGLRSSLALPADSGFGADLVALNERDEVAGAAYQIPREWWRGLYLSPGNEPRWLPGFGINEDVLGMNSHGQIVGSTSVPFGNGYAPGVYPALWDSGSVGRVTVLDTDRSLLGGEYGWAWAANRWGHIVGKTRSGGALWVGGRPYDFTGRIINPHNVRLDYFADINDKGEIIGSEYGISTSPGSRAFVIRPVWPSLAVDLNRDGKISLPTDGDKSDLTSPTMPFRFWINDDDDTGDLGGSASTGTDTPGQTTIFDGSFAWPSGAPDYVTQGSAFDTGKVDGRSDLIDFFPVFLDIKQLFSVLPHTTAGITYKLKQADGAVNFVYTDLTRTEAFHYLRNNQQREDYGEPGNETYAHEAKTWRTTAAGTPLNEAFLNRINDEDDKGVIVVEGRQPTDKPLRLVIEKDGVEIAAVAVSIKISPVEDFYRWLNLRGACGQNETRSTNLNQPPAYPDALTNGKMFVWVHGYNVNEDQSRGWNAEAFKRMWHSGSKAMFTAVSWNGDHSQLPIIRVAPDYWDNIPRAFTTAEALAPLVNSLPGSSKVIAGHSMGNVVVSSAIKDRGMSVTKYLMVDAAVALEAYDTSVSTVGPHYVNAMRPYQWIDYDRRLWSTDWWRLFPEGDNRRRLTWMNRFGDIPNALNIYSSGEEVLNNNDLTPGERPPLGTERVWIQQEMNKGGIDAMGVIAGILAGEIQGGWGFNQAWGSQVWTSDSGGGGGGFYTYVPPTVADANALTDAQLRAQPFFERFDKAALMHADVGAGSSGSDAADDVAIADLLGGAIPALSFPAGRNPVPSFLTARNRNLMTYQDGWPASRLSNQDLLDRWLHSDIRDVAYFFNYRAWDLFTDEGNLR